MTIRHILRPFAVITRDGKQAVIDENTGVIVENEGLSNEEIQAEIDAFHRRMYESDLAAKKQLAHRYEDDLTFVRRLRRGAIAIAITCFIGLFILSVFNREVNDQVFTFLNFLVVVSIGGAVIAHLSVKKSQRYFDKYKEWL